MNVSRDHNFTLGKYFVGLMITAVTYHNAIHSIVGHFSIILIARNSGQNSISFATKNTQMLIHRSVACPTLVRGKLTAAGDYPVVKVSSSKNSLIPKHTRQTTLREHTLSFVSKCSVHALSNTILRGVARN